MNRLAWSLAPALGAATPALAAAPLAGLAGGPAPADGAAFWLRWLGALALCLVLAAGAALALKLRTEGAGSLAAPARWPWRTFAVGTWRGLAAPRRLKRVESLRVTATLEVCILAVDGRELVVAVTPAGATLLTAPDGAPC